MSTKAPAHPEQFEPASTPDKPEPMRLASELRDCISLLDSLAQDYCEGISALCSITLSAMKTPDFWRDYRAIEGAFSLIQARAEDLMNQVNCSASGVGCEWVPLDEGQRMEAYWIALTRHPNGEEIGNA